MMNKFSREFSSKSCFELRILTVLNSLKETQVPGPGEGQQGDRRHLFQDVSHPGFTEIVFCAVTSNEQVKVRSTTLRRNMYIFIKDNPVR